MMKAIAGSMVGGLVAGTIALVATSASQGGVDAGRMTSPTSMPMAAPDERALDDFGFRGAPANDMAPASSTLVECEPHQQALVRRAMVGGREVSTISCVTTTAAVAPAASNVGYATAAPVAAAARPAVIRERSVRREAPQAKKRSWGKTALVVGGTSGAGAGIGALIGGKKGALIGAAIGGGSGAIYEVTKRK